MLDQNIKLLPHQSAVLTAPWKYPNIDYVFLTAGFGCIQEGTIVHVGNWYGPIEDYPTAYVKGRASIYSLRGKDGSHINCTSNHFLWPYAQRPASHLDCIRAGDMILAYTTNCSPACRTWLSLVLSKDVVHWMQTLVSSLYDYLVYYHQYDQQPHFSVITGPGKVPQLDDAQVHSHFSGHKGGLDIGAQHIHLCLSFVPVAAMLKSYDYSTLWDQLNCLFDLHLYQEHIQRTQIAPTCSFEREHISRMMNGECLLSIQQYGLSPSLSILQTKVSLPALHLSYKDDIIQALSEATFISLQEYWDLDVPGHLYQSGGWWHHNSGKSATDVAFVLLLVSLYQGLPLTFGIGGAAIKHLKETVIKDVTTLLDTTHTPYKHNSQEGTLTIGSLTFVYFSGDRPESIFGFNLCMAQGTLITTSGGLVPIQDIVPGTQVLTRTGYHPVLAVHDNGIKEVITSPIGLRGTPDHEIITLPSCDKKITLNSSRLSDIIYISDERRRILWLTLKHLFIKDISTTRMLGGTLSTTTRMALAAYITGTFGKTTMAPFHQGIMYTILTVIPGIIILTILRSCQKLHIIGSITYKRILNGLFKRFENGMSLKMTVRRYSILQRKERTIKHTTRPVSSVAVPSSADMQMQSTVQNVEEGTKERSGGIERTRTLRPLSVRGVVRSILSEIKSIGGYRENAAASLAGFNTQPQLDKVFDLTVSHSHEYYANNVLVHNCLALMDEQSELADPARVKQTMIAVQERCRVPLPITPQVKAFCKQHNLPIPTQPRNPLIISTTTAQGLDGVWRFMQYLKEKHIPYISIQARTQDNPHISKKQLELLYGLYTPDEARVFLDGEFLNLAVGRVYPEYNASRHVYQPFPITQADTIFIGQDMNLAFNACVLCVLRGDIIYVIDEYHWDTVGDAPRKLREKYPNNPLTFIPDASSKEIMQGWREEYDRYGIETIWNSTNPSITERVLVINKLLRTDRLKIFSICKRVQDTLQLHGYDDLGKPKKEKGPDALDHHGDSLSYSIWHIVHSFTGFDDLLAVLRSTSTKWQW